MMKSLSAVLLAALLVVAMTPAEAARRLGGGGSIGKQSGNVTQRQNSTPPPASPNAPTQQSGQAAKPAPAAPAAAPQTPPRRPWGAMLGGLAAGLGLAWLANSLGFGQAFAEFMLIGLVVLLAMVAFGIWRARRAQAQQTAAGPFAFQGAGPVQAPTAYKPENVGNDASARPWERSSMAFEMSRSAPAGTGGGIVIGSALSQNPAWGVPADFDQDGFLGIAKANFVTLQGAWDRADVHALRAMMTDEMVTEIRHQLAEREQHSGGAPNHTEVVMLNAQLLGIEDLGDAYMASVEFSGMIREQPSAGPSPFREVWNMTKPRDGSAGWLVAGLQALQ